MKICALAGFVMLGTLNAAAADIKAIAPDVVGAWRSDFTTPDGEHRTPTVVVGRQHEELVAWYIDKDESQAFKSVTIKDDALELTIDPRGQNGKVTVKLVAKADGDHRCTGKGEYSLADGETGCWDFHGERIDPADLPHVAEWKLKFTTPDGASHEPTIHVLERGDTLYGWYISDDYELLAKTLKVEGDRATLSIAAKTADNVKVDVTFQGTIDGSTIDGTANYNLDGERGSFPFSGSQVEN